MGYEGNKNSLWYPLFGDSILRHVVTVKVGINFKSKNLVVVLHFLKIQVQLNISRICTPKIIERGISRKHPVFDKKKKGYATTFGIYEVGLFEEAEYEISTVYQFPMTFMNSSCEFLLVPGRHEIYLNWPW